jgi:hypothetical protein
MKKPGKPWSEIASARSQALHNRLPEIKLWREQQDGAGKPSELEDFFRAHGLCLACESTGTDLCPVGWDGDVGLFVECKHCGGTGRVTYQMVHEPPAVH